MANALTASIFSRINGTTPLVMAAVSMSLCASEPLSQQELSNRQKRTNEAQQLLLQGDARYQSAEYHEAAAIFLQARNVLPDVPATLDLRSAATERYVAAAMQSARVKSQKGDVAAALALINQVLAPEIAPQHEGAMKLRDQLLDPQRTNPALTKEHAQAIDEVRRTLYEAEGFWQLGKFDMAKSMYEDILRLDPTNKAARRGMEKVNALQSDSARTAYDQTRAEMLSEVDQQWQQAPTMAADALRQQPVESTSPPRMRYVSEKMKTILFPFVDLENVGIEEAVDYLRLQSKTLDNTTTNPSEKGFNLVLQLGSQDSEIGQKVRSVRFDLKLKNVPIDQVLRYLCDQTHSEYHVDEFAITIRPLGADDTQLVGRTYKVPPDFLSAENVGAAAATASADPFATEPEEGLTARRMTALDKLRSYGVSFPDGAKATYNPSSSSIFVYNTAINHDLVQQIVDSLAQTEPVQVIVRVTMIKVLENQLKELGFDWLFGNIGMGNNSGPGGDAAFLGGGTTGSGANIADVSLTAPNNNPVTAGNRSGNSAIRGNAIDDRILTNTLGAAPIPSRAPGVLSLLANDVDGGQIQMLMRGLDQKKGVDVMTKPATITRSGQTSKIEIIQELRYPTEYEPPEIPQGVGNGIGNGFDGFGGGGGAVNNPPITPAMPTSFEKRDIGVILEVSPIVSADRRYIELALKPELVNFDGFVNYGTPITQPAAPSGLAGVLNTNERVILTPNSILQPVFSITRADTNVTVADGSTIVIGGLIEERIQNVQDQVPVLGNLPVVGRLFQSTSRQPIKKNVLIMVQVELQDPSGQPYRQR